VIFEDAESLESATHAQMGSASQIGVRVFKESPFFPRRLNFSNRGEQSNRECFNFVVVESFSDNGEKYW
jgi:hypothetical protein